MLIPLEVYAEVTSLTISLSPYANFYVGLSMDEPLPENFKNIYGKVIGIMPIYSALIPAKFGPTTITVNADVGRHYVILGIQPPEGAFSAFGWRLRIKGAGMEVDRSFGVAEPLTYVYIAFEVVKDSKTGVEMVNKISSGTIAPNGEPIISSGGTSIFSSGSTAVLGETMGALITSMMPLMMFGMMMQLISGLITSVVGMVRF